MKARTHTARTGDFGSVVIRSICDLGPGKHSGGKRQAKRTKKGRKRKR